MRGTFASADQRRFRRLAKRARCEAFATPLVARRPARASRLRFIRRRCASCRRGAGREAPSVPSGDRNRLARDSAPWRTQPTELPMESERAKAWHATWIGRRSRTGRTASREWELAEHTILFVDDEVNILKALKRLLAPRDRGTCSCASRGREALELMDAPAGAGGRLRPAHARDERRRPARRRCATAGPTSCA